MNSYQNCNNVIEKFYSIYLYRSDEIFIQEKINKGPSFISLYIKDHHIKNKCRIERILPSYNNIIVKIVKMLKVGKPVCIVLHELILSNILKILIIIIFNYIQINRFALADSFTYFFILQYNNLHYNDIIYYIYSSNNKDSIKTHNQNIDLFFFKKECKNIFKPYLTIDKILYRLQILIPKWASLFKPTYKNIDFIRHYIHNRSWIWAKKKHPRVSKDYLYNIYFKKGSYNFSILNINKSTVQNININNKYN